MNMTRGFTCILNESRTKTGTVRRWSKFNLINYECLDCELCLSGRDNRHFSCLHPVNTDICCFFTGFLTLFWFSSSSLTGRQGTTSTVLQAVITKWKKSLYSRCRSECSRMQSQGWRLKCLNYLKYLSSLLARIYYGAKLLNKCLNWETVRSMSSSSQYRK